MPIALVFFGYCCHLVAIYRTVVLWPRVDYALLLWTGSRKFWFWPEHEPVRHKEDSCWRHVGCGSVSGQCDAHEDRYWTGSRIQVELEFTFFCFLYTVFKFCVKEYGKTLPSSSSDTTLQSWRSSLSPWFSKLWPGSWLSSLVRQSLYSFSKYMPPLFLINQINKLTEWLYICCAGSTRGLLSLPNFKSNISFEDHENIFVCIFILVGLCFSRYLLCVCMCSFAARRDVTEEANQKRLDSLNTIVTVLVFFILVTNIFITVFGMERTGLFARMHFWFPIRQRATGVSLLVGGGGLLWGGSLVTHSLSH